MAGSAGWMVRAEGGAPRATRRRDVVVRPRRPLGAESAVVRAVLDHGPVARSTIARVTGLSTASVSGVTSRLRDAGILKEVPEAAGPPGMGRPHVPLDIETGRLAVLGIHIAVPAFSVALLDLRGRVLRRVREPYGAAVPAPSDVLDRVAAVVETMRRETEREVVGLGVATGGWVEPATGVLVEHPVLGWREVPLRDHLAGVTGLPVRADGHSRALVRAERLFGAPAEAARGSIVQLFVGNVVDVAFAIGDTVHDGPRGAGGAAAHLRVEGCQASCVCGQVGCLQAAVSERVVLERAVERGIVEVPDFRRLLDIARSGDDRALALFHERARLVGRAVATLLDLFNPQVLTVLESASVRIPGVFASLLAEASRCSTTVDPAEVAERVRPSSFAADALVIAGGAVLMDWFYAHPLDLFDARRVAG